MSRGEARGRGADRTRAGDLSPIWRLLTPSGSEVRVVALPESNRAWRDVLDEGLEPVRTSGGSAIVVLDRPGARAFLSLLAHGRWSMPRAPSPRAVRRRIHQLGGEVEACHVLWPSARGPRIAFPRRRHRLIVWAQRSGVLGGGGNRLWARKLARSVLFTPWAVVISPGLAFVVRFREEANA